MKFAAAEQSTGIGTRLMRCCSEIGGFPPDGVAAPNDVVVANGNAGPFAEMANPLFCLPTMAAIRASSFQQQQTHLNGVAATGLPSLPQPHRPPQRTSMFPLLQGFASAQASSLGGGAGSGGASSVGSDESKPSAADLLGCATNTLAVAQMGGTNSQNGREPKPFKCGHCPKAFANNSYLSQHMRIHLGIRAFGPCQFCGKKFTQLSHLQQHIRTHTGEKPYKCKFANCEKAFSQLSNLQSHSRCHQSDRPFKCNSCYKCFADEATLLEHIPRHRESKHLKVHICPFCGKSYSQALYLDKHMTKHTDRRNDMRFPKGYYANGLDGALSGASFAVVDPHSVFDGLGGHLGLAGAQHAANEEFTLKHFQQQMAAASAAQQHHQQQQQQQLAVSTAAAAALSSSASAASALAGYGTYGNGTANSPFGTGAANSSSAGPMATANVVNQMAIGNSALSQLNFFGRSLRFADGTSGATAMHNGVGTTANRGFNMITPLENIKHFNQNSQQQQSGQTASFQ